MLVELDGEEHRARARVLEGGDEEERARTLVFDKYAARGHGDLASWRQRALPVAVEQVAPRSTPDATW